MLEGVTHVMKHTVDDNTYLGEVGHIYNGRDTTVHGPVLTRWKGVSHDLRASSFSTKASIWAAKSGCSIWYRNIMSFMVVLTFVYTV